MGFFDRFKKAEERKDEHPYEVSAPVAGLAVDITEVKDEAFRSAMLGKGVGIHAEGETDVVTAPVSGEISVLFPTLHAVGLVTDEGVEVLIHIGVDTVNLEGEGFKAYVSQGQKVKRGDRLVEVNFRKLEEKGYDMTVMTIVSNTEEWKEVISCPGTCTKEDYVIHVVA